MFIIGMTVKAKQDDFYLDVRVKRGKRVRFEIF